ncbi:MAG: ABC transporter ATP-binding protein [Alphaproteobacteria bacterium]|nr:ABC transporter ATP-binding protein [Pseudomonadota bacterium]
MTAPQVELRTISKHYGPVVAVDDVSLSITPGEFVVLLGPSGSGKTTILSMIGGFVTPTSGEVFIAGQLVTHLPPAKRPSATVFQDYALFPHMTVAGNIGFGLSMHKVAKPERKQRTDSVLGMVGLEGMGGRGVHELSGGQRQRVALARAIAVQPSVLLLDEPLGALDLKIRRQMQEELTGIQRKIGTTFIHVTHDQEEAMSIADIIVVINHGKIEDMGPPQRIYRHPTTCFVASFMGESNVITGTARARQNGEVQVDTPLGNLRAEGDAEEGTEVHLCLRPEQLRLGPGDGDETISLGSATVSETIFQGNHLRVRAQGGANNQVRLLLEVEPDAEVVAGRSIDIHVRMKDIVLLKD